MGNTMPTMPHMPAGWGSAPTEAPFIHEHSTSPLQTQPSNNLAMTPAASYIDPGYGPTPTSTFYNPTPLIPGVTDFRTRDFNTEVVPCDLSKRLASLDAACQDLSADVRSLTTGTATTTASTSAAVQESSSASPPRRVHRI